MEVREEERVQPHLAKAVHVDAWVSLVVFENVKSTLCMILGSKLTDSSSLRSCCILNPPERS